MKHLNILTKLLFSQVSKSIFWFLTGAALGIFLLTSFTFIFFQQMYDNKLYPGVMVNGIPFTGKTQEEVYKFFEEKNEEIADTTVTLAKDDSTTTVTAYELKLGYDSELLSKQAYSIGRSNDLLANISLAFQGYLHGINLSPSYKLSNEKFEAVIDPIVQRYTVEPADALFSFQDGRVVAFKPSSDGTKVDVEKAKKLLLAKTPLLFLKNSKNVTVPITIEIVQPKVTTNKANNLGIKELIGTGTSLFQGSIQNRIYNITLAATRMNGILVAPNEVFSFNKALGDISVFTGYKQAYVIQNGKTVLGDGGGVCQVSTTLFRAALNAGLPIVERHAHAYRVGYYEQDSSPGLDATIYSPTVDLRFKNDTGNHILIQSFVDPDFARLTFVMYGTNDGRQTTITKPVITSQSPPGETVYQDDPTLPKGQLKQTEYAAYGATVNFTRQVVKNGKTIISEKFTSHYRPWAAVYLRGTKEG